VRAKSFASAVSVSSGRGSSLARSARRSGGAPADFDIEEPCALRAGSAAEATELAAAIAARSADPEQRWGVPEKQVAARRLFEAEEVGAAKKKLEEEEEETAKNKAEEEEREREREDAEPDCVAEARRRDAAAIDMGTRSLVETRGMFEDLLARAPQVKGRVPARRSATAAAVAEGEAVPAAQTGFGRMVSLFDAASECSCEGGSPERSPVRRTGAAGSPGGSNGGGGKGDRGMTADSSTKTAAPRYQVMRERSLIGVLDTPVPVAQSLV
jgi:hypothetical protein